MYGLWTSCMECAIYCVPLVCVESNVCLVGCRIWLNDVARTLAERRYVWLVWVCIVYRWIIPVHQSISVYSLWWLFIYAWVCNMRLRKLCPLDWWFAFAGEWRLEFHPHNTRKNCAHAIFYLYTIHYRLCVHIRYTLLIVNVYKEPSIPILLLSFGLHIERINMSSPSVCRWCLCTTMCAIMCL